MRTGTNLTEMSEENLSILESIFAIRTENGWELPMWIHVLRHAIEETEPDEEPDGFFMLMDDLS
jgi:hypothetical protein